MPAASINGWSRRPIVVRDSSSLPPAIKREDIRMSEFYIRNKNAGFLGNSPTWYGKNGKGYTAYLTGAERFTEEQADKMVEEDSSKWEKFNCDHVDARLHLIFDDQDKYRLGTDEPCGWFKYADNPAKVEEQQKQIDKLNKVVEAAKTLLPYALQSSCEMSKVTNLYEALAELND